jgi:uncharacterized membrane protein YjfL (UPF0719 family)
MRNWTRVAWAIGGALVLGAAARAAWAQGAAPAGSWRPTSMVEAVTSTVLFGVLGIILAIVGFKVFDIAVRFNLEQEICEKQNLAVAILCAGMVIGICIVIAAAVL